ncbi:MAG: hypothetical protein PVJ57_09975 [Phycisphaerae bacterium]|jgi:hypothetical protein
MLQARSQLTGVLLIACVAFLVGSQASTQPTVTHQGCGRVHSFFIVVSRDAPVEQVLAPPGTCFVITDVLFASPGGAPVEISQEGRVIAVLRSDGEALSLTSGICVASGAAVRFETGDPDGAHLTICGYQQPN